MPRDYAALPHDQVRRRDRAVEDDAWIRDFLHRAAFGTFATVYEGRPFLNQNIFVYDEAEHALYLHTARVGRTAANVGEGIPASFCVGEMGRMLPADEALHFSVEYASVVVFGDATIVRDEGEAARVLQRLLDKYAPHLRPGRDYRPVVAEEVARTTAYRLAVSSWTGKKKEVAPDFPGAYRFPDFPGATAG